MRTLPYGTWPSPLSPEVLAGARVSVAGLQVVGDTVWWSESRPREQGRTVVLRLRPGSDGVEEVSPPEVSVRSRLHEYGGGAHFADGEGLLYTDFADQALWWLEPGHGPRRLTPPAPAGEEHRYADARTVPGTDYVVSLRERHHPGGVDDEVVAIDRGAPAPPTLLLGGRDFYAAPRPSPDGRQLAWVAWDHPHMPWDESELWCASLVLPPSGAAAGGAAPQLTEARRLAGGPDESVGQPTWAGADLWFVSDRFGWWQPFRLRPGAAPQRMCDAEAEFHHPDWALGQSTLAVGPDGRLLCRLRRDGRDHVGVLDPRSGGLTLVDQPCVTVAGVAADDRPGAAVVLGSTPTGPTAVHRVGPDGAAPVVLHRAAPAVLDPAWVSEAEPLVFPTAAGTPAYLLFYAPTAPDCAGPATALPPLVVLCHGGPTAGAEPGFDPAVQMWTTRGLAVAVVDYRGSTGHGRAFRRQLDYAWGEADAEDCRSAAAYLAGAGLVDGGRMVAKGSSAGGLTALRCLDAGGPFAAAVVACAVTDLAALAADTHKFESRYLDRLVGPWPAAAAVYAERSPASHPERLEGAVLLLQGAEDPIVPPDQASRLATALRARGLRCDHVVFDGEGHGFRRAETLAAAAELEIGFVTDVLGLSPAPVTPPP